MQRKKKVKRRMRAPIRRQENEGPQTLLSKLENVQSSKNGEQYSARCPAHDDNRNSLSVGIGEHGRILLDCKAGCDVADVVRALGMKMSDLTPSTPAVHAKSKVKETYDYRNEDGDVVVQVCRYEPKDFRQRRPDRREGWVWDAKGVKHVPYRLPELCEAKKSAIVYIVEGEKDAEALHAIGCVATCNIGGAGKWRDAYNEHFRGRKVVVIPDNDSAGRNHAEDVAKNLDGVAKSVKVVHLPRGDDKADVSDWLEDGHTKTDLIKLAKRTKPWVPDEIAAFKPFPTEVLPSPASKFVRSAAASIGCDESYVALPMLSAIAAAIGNTRRVQLKKQWTEPCIIWTVIVGKSGTVKSPAIEVAVRPLLQRQDEAFVEFQAKNEEFRQHQKLHDVEYKRWQRKSQEQSAGQKEYPPIPPTEPVCERFVCSDTTVEALAQLLSQQPRGLLVYRDELSGWAFGFDAYKATSGVDEAHWLSMHRAGALTVDRKGGQATTHVAHASVSVTGGIQPAVLDQVLNRHSFDTGLASRLLFAFPPQQRRVWTEAEIPDELQDAVDCLFEGLLELQFSPDGESDHAPIDIKLSKDGKKAFVDFFNEHAAEQQSLEGEVAAAWSKLEGYAARLALIVHLIRQVTGDESLLSHTAIDVVSVNAGVALSRWFGGEAARVYAEVGDEHAAQAHEDRELIALIR